MEKKLITAKVFRFDPKTDKTARFQTYSVPYRELSVLQVLAYISENVDATLSFRSGCTQGQCGACAISVNGRAAFACRQTASRNLVIEPHPKFEVIKDLVVDFNKKRR